MKTTMNKVLLIGLLASLSLVGCKNQNTEPRVQFCESQTEEAKGSGIKIYLDEKEADKLVTVILDEAVSKPLAEQYLKAHEQPAAKKDVDAFYKAVINIKEGEYKYAKKNFESSYYRITYDNNLGGNVFRTRHIFYLTKDTLLSEMKKENSDTRTILGYFGLEHVYDSEKGYFTFQRLKSSKAWAQWAPLKCKPYDEEKLKQEIKAHQEKIKEQEKANAKQKEEK